MNILEQIEFLEEITDITLTAEEVRSLIDGETIDALDEALDNAQGNVYSGKSTVEYVVIKVIKDK